MPSLVEIGRVVLEKKMKMWKVYRRTDRQTTDDRWSVIQLRWANYTKKRARKVTVHIPNILECCQFPILLRNVIIQLSFSAIYFFGLKIFIVKYCWNKRRLNTERVNWYRFQRCHTKNSCPCTDMNA